jgi:hypothetical protein
MAVTRLNEAVMSSIFGTVTERLSPDIVAPVAAYRVHRECTLNGEVLSAAGGRVARFALGSGPAIAGLRSPEQVRDAFEAGRVTEPARWWAPPVGETRIA